MVSHSARVINQYGVSLLELLLALSLGSLVILATTQLLMASISASTKIQQHISVQEKLVELQVLLSKELRRAGFHFLPNHTAAFSDHSDVVYVDPTEQDLGLVYQVKANGAEAFRNLYFNYVPASTQLKLCDKYSSAPLTSNQAAASSFGSSCYALLDANQFRLTNFRVTNATLASSVFSSSMVGVEMTLALAAEPQVAHSISFSIKQRNWQ